MPAKLRLHRRLVAPANAEHEIPESHRYRVVWCGREIGPVFAGSERAERWISENLRT